MTNPGTLERTTFRKSVVGSLVCLAATNSLTFAELVEWEAGVTGSYDVADNWIGDFVPIAGDEVQINQGGTVEVGPGVSAPADGNLFTVLPSDGTISVSGGSLATENLQIVGSAGALAVSGGTVTVSSDVRITAADGSINITGGLLILPKLTLGSGATASPTSMSVSGDAIVVQDQDGAAARELWIGGNNGGDGTLTLSGNASWTNQALGETSSYVAVGRFSGGTGVLTMEDDATFTVVNDHPDPLSDTRRIRVPSGAGGLGDGTINLNGGNITTVGFWREGGAGTINADGGTITALRDTTDFFLGFTGSGGTGNGSVNLLEGGLKFDTGEFDVLVTSVLSGPGSLEKLGTGVLELTGTATYTGDTIITEGELILTTVALDDDANVSIADGGGLFLDHQLEDVVGSLTLGGVQVAAGTWGSSASDADNVDNDYFAGTGILRVGDALEGRDLVWTGAENSFWGTLFDDINFVDETMTPVTFAAGDNATFDDTSSVTDVDLDGNVQAGVVTIAGSQPYVFNGGNAGLVGSASIVMNNSARVTLGGATSTFTGPIDVNSGTLAMGDPQAFGLNSGITVASGAQVDINGQAPGPIHSYTISGAGPDDLGAITNSSPANVFSGGGVGHLVLSEDASVGGNDGRFDLARDGTITGNGFTLTKVGSSEMAFRGDASGSPIDIVIAGGSAWAENLDTAFGGPTGTLTVLDQATAGTFGPRTINTPVTLEAGSALTNLGGGTATWQNSITLNGGATIGGGDAIVLSGAIAGPGSLTKTGGNTVTLDQSPGYAGDTVVQGGVLALNADGLADAADVEIQDGAVLDLGHGASDSVNSLTLGGAPAAVGTWGSSLSGAANQDDTFFQGTGILNVLSVATTPYSEWAASNGLAGADADANADPDRDGVENLIEFMVGGDPSGPDSDSSDLLPTAVFDGEFLDFTYRRVADRADGYDDVVEYSTDLDGFVTAVDEVDGVEIIETPDGFEPGVDRVVVRIPASLAVDGRLFVRLRASLP